MLFDALRFEGNDIYVHIDKKSKAVENDIACREDIFILEQSQRVDVKWGQISQVDATLQLINRMIAGGRTYDFVWLISGQDFPLKSAAQINEFLSLHTDTAFIEIIDPSTKRHARLLKRNEIYSAQWSINKNFMCRILRNMWYLLSGGRYHTFGIFRRKLANDKFYFGSQWWCLPYGDVLAMTEYLKSNPKFYEFFSHCHCPDESFFQTLFVNHAGHTGDVRDILTYIDWNGCKDSPRTFTAEDYDALVEKEDAGYCLARKFDNVTDKTILEKLSENLHD